MRLHQQKLVSCSPYLFMSPTVKYGRVKNLSLSVIMISMIRPRYYLHYTRLKAFLQWLLGTTAIVTVAMTLYAVSLLLLSALFSIH